MKVRTRKLLALVVVLPLLQSCVTGGATRTTGATGTSAAAPQGSAQGTQTNAAAPATSPPTPSAASSANAASGGPAAPAQRRTIASVTRGAQKFEGLFTMYQDTANGALHLVVPKDKLGSEFIYFTKIVDAPTSTDRFRGMFRDNYVFSIRRHFNRIEFVAQNTGYWFDPSSPLSRAAGANISPATVAVQEIVAEDSVAFLIKADDIFLAEAFTQVKPSAPPPTPNAVPRFTLGNLSKAKSRVLAVRNYPANTDVLVEYVYENPSPIVRGGQDVTDSRNVSVSVQHSLLQMPRNDYQPRFDDPRVGFFTTRVTDMLSTRAAPYRDLVQRWHLVKKDPAAPISEPVEPIVFWIENTTPHEFRGAIREGVLRWNEAFEAAGFRNALQVQVQPDDSEWDAGDIRYNVLRWTSSPNPPFGGYGPSFVNPRTGQIIGADIMLEYVYVTNRVKFDNLYARAGLSHMGEEHDGDEHEAGRFCTYGESWQQNLMLGRQVLEARSASPIEMKELVEQSLIELVMHEVGHTLGLNHNMRASQAVSRERVHDRAYTAQQGLMGSVMDYGTINVAGAGKPQGEYYMTRAGAYDIWAIQFGYTPSLADPLAERARMNALLARSTEPALAFGNDGDDMRAPGRGIDPRVMVDDMTDDAIGYSIERFNTVEELLGGLVRKYSRPGESYHELRSAYLILSGQQANAATVISRYVGGVYVDRAVVGQPGATQPFTPVSRGDQKRAMRALERYVFGPQALSGSSELYAHLQMQRRGFDFFGSTEDPKIHERTLNMQRGVLNHLLHPRVMTRITDSRQYGNEYPLTEMLGDLTQAIFTADLRGNVNTFRQQLQLEYVNRLASIVTPPTNAQYDFPSRSAALASLRSVQQMMRSRSAGDAETRAHTQHVLFVIEKALKTD
jgi:hypothetical protein